MSKRAIGIDIGGTGIKAAVVNLRDGSLIGERVRQETPAGGKPGDIAKVVAELITQLPDARAKMLVGICFPAIVRDGITMSAANSRIFIPIYNAVMPKDSVDNEGKMYR